MPVKLNWDLAQGSAQPDKVEIYRTERDITEASEVTTEEKIGEVLGTVKEYSDETALYGKTYRYVLKTVKGIDSIFGYINTIPTHRDTGLGPKQPISFSRDFVYYGTLDREEFLTISGWTALLGINTGAIAASVAFNWHKISLGGKILIFPSVALNQGIGFKAVYDRGAIHGTGTAIGNEDVDGTPYSPVLQDLRLELEGYQYIVRAPSVIAEGQDPATTILDGNSEIERILNVLSQATGANSKDHKLRYDDATTFVGGASRSIITRDVVINRSSTFKRATFANITNATSYRKLSAMNQSASSTSITSVGTLCFLPIFELVDEVAND